MTAGSHCVSAERARLSCEVVMHRLLALLALPLLVSGCGSAGSSRSSAEPATTIDSFRSAYFSGQQPAASSQLAEMPPPAGGQAKAPPKSLAAGRSGNAAQASQGDGSAAGQASDASYKAAVAAYIKRYAVDRDSLKLAKIGTPFPGSVNGQRGSIVCVQLGQLSENRTAYLLKDDTVIDSELRAPDCRDKHLEPWPNVGT
jgi:hypothetical protein